MADDDDTLVLARSKKTDNFMRLVPANRALTEEIVLNLSQLARIGRTAGAPNHPNFYGVQNKVVSRTHVDIWEAEDKVNVVERRRKKRVVLDFPFLRFFLLMNSSCFLSSFLSSFLFFSL